MTVNEQFGECFDADECVLDRDCQFYRVCSAAEADE
jgi:hypothetical protein